MSRRTAVFDVCYDSGADVFGARLENDFQDCHVRFFTCVFFFFFCNYFLIFIFFLRFVIVYDFGHILLSSFWFCVCNFTFFSFCHISRLLSCFWCCFSCYFLLEFYVFTFV